MLFICLLFIMSEQQEILQTIGKKIQQLREERKLTQMDLAYEAETSMAHLSKIENGRHAPGIFVIIRIAKVLKVKPSEIFQALDTFV